MLYGKAVLATWVWEVNGTAIRWFFQSLCGFFEVGNKLACEVIVFVASFSGCGLNVVVAQWFLCLLLAGAVGEMRFVIPRFCGVVSLLQLIFLRMGGFDATIVLLSGCGFSSAVSCGRLSGFALPNNLLLCVFSSEMYFESPSFGFLIILCPTHCHLMHKAILLVYETACGSMVTVLCSWPACQFPNTCLCDRLSYQGSPLNNLLVGVLHEYACDIQYFLDSTWCF